MFLCHLIHLATKLIFTGHVAFTITCSQYDAGDRKEPLDSELIVFYNSGVSLIYSVTKEAEHTVLLCVGMLQWLGILELHTGKGK